MQNNLHLSFSFFDSARTGVPWLVPVIVLHNNITLAQSKSLIVPKNFIWREDPLKNPELNFLRIRGQCKKINLNSRRGMGIARGETSLRGVSVIDFQSESGTFKLTAVVIE